ncbi:hypothetical protein [Flammeovirga agarivorans]|uniref:Uncharacterized protein n=1 Tax=Flammeovirga agarivorans TaxID=2726742 RepID=A0A7X8SGK4_9BACT|nr:hypothetical protein [Flammeovirga agarivorans]NLR89830.1 hypothetical protein [Flammeovirga agarivorans]
MDTKILSYIRQNFVGELLHARHLIDPLALANEDQELLLNGEIKDLLNIVVENGQGAKLNLSEKSIKELNRAFSTLRANQPSCACG